MNPAYCPFAYETVSIMYPENGVPAVGAAVIELIFRYEDVADPVEILICLLKSMLPLLSESANTCFLLSPALLRCKR